MEEKKLTDEEALNAVRICHTDGIHCSTCPAYKYGDDNCDSIAGLALVDYCRRLQSENERLNKCVMSEEQIRNCCADIIQETMIQAAKNTAKEIWGDCIDKIMRGCGDDKEFWVMKILIETFKKFGVGFEVE